LFSSRDKNFPATNADPHVFQPVVFAKPAAMLESIILTG
tara:strand:+ start:589 stop:705 length:117 start_codon:yes stop_codon:yes gene_type:complete